MGEKNNQPQQNINELLKVRRDKLAELQAKKLKIILTNLRANP